MPVPTAQQLRARRLCLGPLRTAGIYSLLPQMCLCFYGILQSLSVANPPRGAQEGKRDLNVLGNPAFNHLESTVAFSPSQVKIFQVCLALEEKFFCALSLLNRPIQTPHRTQSSAAPQWKSETGLWRVSILHSSVEREWKNVYFCPRSRKGKNFIWNGSKDIPVNKAPSKATSNIQDLMPKVDNVFTAHV